MTDKQPDALHLADIADDDAWAFVIGVRKEIAAELRRQYAEIETLRAKLKTYEDLGDAADDVQLLRMGYAAARLEIESLKSQLAERAKEHADELTVAYMCGASWEKELAAQQPGAAGLIGALEDAQRAIDSMKVEAETAAQGDEQMMLEACETISNEGLQADMAIRAALASHGQAPAQAAPAAVAGPIGYGPKVTVRRSCSDCKACNSESYAVQGDSGHYVYCEHPSLPESKYIGDTNWNTPHWCPVSAPTTQPAPQQVPTLHDLKAALDVFNTARAGSDKPSGYLRGIRAVLIHWEGRSSATSVLEDAARWHWFAEYLVGPRTDLDDEIVASETVNDLRKLVDAARAAQEGKSHG